MLNEIKQFIRFHIANSIFRGKIENANDIAEPIKKAVDDLSKTVQGKRNDIVNPESISDPIVEAQKATTEAVRSIPKVDIPKTDLSSLEEKLDRLIESLDNKEMSVKIGKTKVDTKSIVKSIEKLRGDIVNMEKQEVIDYTMMLDEMMRILEKPKDYSEIIKLQELVKNLNVSEELAIIAEWLQFIAFKEIEQPAFKFNEDGQLEVAVDRVGGGGGGGLTQIETDALIGINNKVATEDKQDSIIENQTNETQVSKVFGKHMVSTANSSTTPLAGDAVFTGTGELITQYASTHLTVLSDQDSATNGLSIEFSNDNVNWDHKETHSITANQSEVVIIPHNGAYFRIVYTNGSTQQTFFRLHVHHLAFPIGIKSEKISGDIQDNHLAQVTKTVLFGKKPNGVYSNVDITAGGNLKVSIEEQDGGAGLATSANQIPTGTDTDWSVTLTNSATAYALFSAPTSNYELTIYNPSDTDIYIRKTTGTTLGVLLPSGGTMNITMGANKTLYAYCSASGKTLQGFYTLY